MQVVVSDTSVISNFMHLNRLDLLRMIYRQVVIPPTVWNELGKLEQIGFDISILTDAEWIRVVEPDDQTSISKLRGSLDMGEVEALILAEELSADFLLIDELPGRKEAARRNIATIGTLGILLKAKTANLIPHIKPPMDTLRTAGFWISPALYAFVLKQAEES